MTNQEAIEKFKKIKRGNIFLIHQRIEGKEVIEDYSLCDMAISALQAQEETVSRKVYEQISWERDIAVMQLKDLGYGLGEKIRTDGGTISRQAAIDEIKALYEWHDTVTEDRTIDHLKRLPSAQPRQTDCGYCHEDFDGYVRPIEKNSHAWLVRRGRTMKLRVCFKGGYRECDILFCPMCGRRLTDG